MFLINPSSFSKSLKPRSPTAVSEVFIMSRMTSYPTEPPQRARRAPRDPTVHNAEDDEMRFTGLHPKTEIPSRSFKHLQKAPYEGSQNHAGDSV